jgi:hypothetical protein
MLWFIFRKNPAPEMGLDFCLFAGVFEVVLEKTGG